MLESSHDYLNYLKTKDGKEIDFLVTESDSPSLLAETKWSNQKRSPNFAVFKKFYPHVRGIQFVNGLEYEKPIPMISKYEEQVAGWPNSHWQIETDVAV